MKLSIITNSLLFMLFLSSCVSDSEVSQQETQIAENKNIQVVHNAVESTFEEAVQFKANLDNPYYYNDSDEPYIHLLVQLTGNESDQSTKRTPLNISMVMDRSGSMSSENKLKKVKEACTLIAENLGNFDKLSLVTYDTHVDILSESSLMKDKLNIKRTIANIQSGGSTNLSGGMLTGYQQVKSTFDQQAVNRVLLLSDGLANSGITDVKELQSIANLKYIDGGMAISTFGVGANYNEDLMTNLAEYGKGNYYFIDSSDDIPQLLKTELDGLLSVVAQNATLEIDVPSSYFELEKVYGYEYEKRGNKIYIDYNDIFSNQEKTVLLKLKVKKEFTEQQTLKVKLDYDNTLDNYRHFTETKSIHIQHTDLKSELEANFNKDVLRNIILFEAAERFDQATYYSDKGEYDKAQELIIDNVTYLNESFENVTPDSALIKSLQANEFYSSELKRAEEMNAREKSEMQKYNKSYNYRLKKKKIK